MLSAYGLYKLQVAQRRVEGALLDLAGQGQSASPAVTALKAAHAAILKLQTEPVAAGTSSDPKKAARAAAKAKVLAGLLKG